LFLLRTAQRESLSACPPIDRSRSGERPQLLRICFRTSGAPVRYSSAGEDRLFNFDDD
jgi:hypothetical protein